MGRIPEVSTGYPVKAVARLTVVALMAGCGEDAVAPPGRPPDPLIGYWGFTSVVQDGVVTYSGPGDGYYWVIYGNETVCLIELLPSGGHVKDSTFV